MRTAPLTDPFKQAIIAQLVLDYIPIAVSYRYNEIEHDGYTKYTRNLKKFKDFVSTSARRSRQTVSEFVFNQMYQYSQQKRFKSDVQNQLLQTRLILVVMEEADYFKTEEGYDPMLGVIDMARLEKGLELR